MKNENPKRDTAFAEPQTSRLENWVFGVIFLLSIVAALWAMTRELNKPLLDFHSFRQTQTAISAFYMVDDPLVFFDYITPVLGKPWAITMELPIYQWIVARLHNLSGIGLDESGKLVSLGFWLASMLPIWLLFADLGVSRARRLIACVIALSSPLYLYWGRAFMMETTALFFSLMMVSLIYRGYLRRQGRLLTIGLCFGIAAALVKVTTWCIAAGVIGLLILFANAVPQWRNTKWLFVAGSATLIPVIPAKLWLNYGDSVKQLNPFARRMMLANSPEQLRWNFGSWEQKLSPDTWYQIWRHVADQLIVPESALGLVAFSLIIVAAIALNRARRSVILVFLCGFVAAPLVFTNLYFEHSYYWSANSIWMLFAISLAIIAVLEVIKSPAVRTITAVVLVGFIAGSGALAWYRDFRPVLEAIPSTDVIQKTWADTVKRLVPSDRTVLIVGNGWNPNSLYYAERKGIAYPLSGEVKFTFPGPELEECLRSLTHAERLGAVVFSDNLLSGENSNRVSLYLSASGFSLRGYKTPFGVLFPAVDLEPN